MANYDFKPDLRDGQQGQNVMKHFLEMYFGLKCLSQGITSEYDLKMVDPDSKKTTLYEVKTDLYEKDYLKGTGNLVLEFECRGKASGIQVTRADYYIWYLPLIDRDQIWKASVGNLMFGFTNNMWKTQPIGEYSEKMGEKSGLACLIPRYEFKHTFEVYSMDGKGNFWKS